MCKFASFVLTRDREFWSDTSDSHEDIINEHGLHADGSMGPNVLRVEITPPTDGDMGDLARWCYRIDQDITPEWASRCDVAVMAVAEARARAAMARRFVAGISVGGELDLSECTGLTALPEGLKVSGGLDLPEHLKRGRRK